MAKHQTRRSISVKGSTYRRLKVRCEEKGWSMSGWIEELIAPYIADVSDPGPPTKYPTRAEICLDDLRAIETAFGQRFTR